MRIEKSLKDVDWVLTDVDADRVQQLVQRHGFPEFIARLLVIRGVAEDDVDSFLYPSLNRDFPDPFSLQGMEDLAACIANGIQNGRKFGVFGDFDVDGATSTAQWVLFFRKFGVEVPFYIPDRLKEGYGPNLNGFKTLKDQGAETIIICDCGITAFDAIRAAKEDLGLDVIVLDHHEAEDTLPDAIHIINPKRKDDTSGLDYLAACGVVFLTLVAINAKLKEASFYQDNNIEPLDMRSFLDLVAFGTVCDMVPLIGANRLFVHKGFDYMSRRENVGIAALAEISKIEGDFKVDHAGFSLGPRINAGSRMYRSDLGAQLLSSHDIEEARNIAFTLNDCNEKRKSVQKDMYAHAATLVESHGLQNDPMIVVGHKDWHSGLTGLVSGRLKDRYKKPAVAISYVENEDGVLEGRGSGRSVDGFDMGSAFIAARNEGILERGGGHAMAAGFTILPEKLDDFRIFLRQHHEEFYRSEDNEARQIIDSLLSVSGIKIDFAKLVDQHFGPFGQMNQKPVFLLPNVRLHKVDILGETHIRAMISDWEGGSWIKAMAFSAVNTPMGKAFLKDHTSQPFHLIGQMTLNEWNGRESAEFHIQDAVYAMKQPQELSEEEQNFAAAS